MSDGELGSLVARLAADLTDLKRGLLEGKQQLSGLKDFTEQTVHQVKELLKFAGISLGLYEIISQVKEFGRSILEEGSKMEVLRASMYALGQNFQITGQSLDFYVQKLKAAGVQDDTAFRSINAFLKAGLSIDLLPQLLQAAKDLAPSMALPYTEAFDNLIQGIVKGTPKQLAELVPGIKQAIQGASTETKKLMDTAVISGTERAQIMLDYVLAAADKAKGAGEAVADSYMNQLVRYRLAVKEAKDALFEIFKPVAMAVTKETIQTWEDFYRAIGRNRLALQDLGEAAAVYIGRIAGTIRTVAAFVVQHKELAEAILTVGGIVKVMKWTGLAAGAEAVSGLLVKLGLLRAALAGPWTLVLALSVVGLKEGIAAIDAAVKKQPSVGTAMGLGEAWGVQTDKQRAAQTALDQAADDAVAAQRGLEARLAQAEMAISAMSPAERTRKGPTATETQAKNEADAAAELERQRQAAFAGAGKGGKGGKETADALLNDYLQMLEQKRQADLQEAQNSLDLLKATDEQKKAELETSLAEGAIDGQTYYQRLQEMAQAETAAALALIEKKRQAQIQANQEALESLGQQDLSPEARDIAQQRLAAQNRMVLAQLDAEAAKTRLAGEVKVTNELKRQVDLRKQYQEKTEDLQVETAQLLGAVSGQEATLQKLYLDWQRAKQAAITAGAYSPEYTQALAANYQAKQAEAQYGGLAGSITSGLSSLVDAISDGTQDVLKSLRSFFKTIFTEALKPGLEQLKGQLIAGFKSLFGEAGGGLASAVLGAIALIGMLLTSSGSSSWSASGTTSSVTAHEVVRGVVAGETTIDVAKVSEAFEEALVTTNGILSTGFASVLAALGGASASGGAGGGESAAIYITATSKEDLFAWLQEYFRDYLMTGATG
jgi:hypothetical protein